MPEIIKVVTSSGKTKKMIRCTAWTDNKCGFTDASARIVREHEKEHRTSCTES